MKSKHLLLGLAISAMILSSQPSRSQDTVVIHDTVRVAPVSTPLENHDSVILKTTDSTTSTVPVSTITAPSNVTIFGLKVPVWVGTIFLSLLTVLPGIQLILKKIPQAQTIGGILGKILDFLTSFQKNVVITPPPPDTTKNP